jgi:hypothetical protein
MNFRLEIRVGDRVILREVTDVPDSKWASDNHALVLKFLLDTAPTEKDTCKP